MTKGAGSREQLGFLEDDAGDDDGGDTDKVGGGRYPAGFVKQRAGNQADDRELCRAGDEGGGHNGHLAVAVIFNGAGRHNTRHAAAGADEHWDETLSREAEFAENTVQNKCNAGHVTDVLQNGEHQEQYKHLRHKAQDRAYAAYNSVQNKP